MKRNRFFFELFSESSIRCLVVERVDGHRVLVLLVLAAVQVDVVSDRSVNKLVLVLKNFEIKNYRGQIF